MIRSSTITLLLLFSLLCLNIRSVYPEGKPLSEVLDQLTDSKNKITVNFGDDTNESTKSAIENILDPEGAAQRKQEKAQKSMVFLHYRSKDGVLFPTETTLNKSVDTESYDQNENIVSDYFSSLKVDYSPIPNCKQSKTEKVQNGSGEKDSVYLDVLYISSEDLNKDIRATYGEDVEIRTFDKNGISNYSAIMRETGVTCAPFRIRIVGSYEYKLYGADATRKY